MKLILADFITIFLVLISIILMIIGLLINNGGVFLLGFIIFIPFGLILVVFVIGRGY